MEDIAIAHLCCARYSLSTHVPRHFQAHALSRKLNKNIELMTLALTWCANIFVGCSVNPTFFWQITSFSDSFHYATKQKTICAWEVLIISHNTIQIGPNWYMDRGLRDLEVAFFKATTYVAKIYQIGLYMPC